SGRAEAAGGYRFVRSLSHPRAATEVGMTSGRNWGELLRLQRLFDLDLFAFLDLDDPVQALVARHGHVDYVGAGVQVKIKWRGLVEDSVVDHDLCALRLGLHADNAHAGGIAAAEDFLEFASGAADVVGLAELRELDVHGRGLAGLYVHRLRRFQVSVSPN